jgi:deazaflavin-dependent oxidoreductase (nitroreductase family)
MAADIGFKTMNAIHRVALKLTGGRAGWTLLGMPALELTTIGRKSGQPRTVMLTSPLQEGSTVAVVASRGGDDKPPAWYLNIVENPDVEVSYQGGPKQPMKARVADAAERQRLWPRITSDHRNYAGYQKKTQREIPVVLLEPVS